MKRYLISLALILSTVAFGVTVDTNTLTKTGNISATSGLNATTVAALGLKQDAASAVTLTGTQTLLNKVIVAPAITLPTGIVKGDVGLSNVDNTSDANKPVSTATQYAINAIYSGTNTWTAPQTFTGGTSTGMLFINPILSGTSSGNIVRTGTFTGGVYNSGTYNGATFGDSVTFNGPHNTASNQVGVTPNAADLITNAQASAIYAAHCATYDFDYSSSTIDPSITGSGGTWMLQVPANCTSIRAFLVQAGSGGGSGRKGDAGTIRCGGGGGLGGGVSEITIPRSRLGSGAQTLVVSIGAGGLGGAGQAVANTNGNNGTNGAATSVYVGSISNNTRLAMAQAGTQWLWGQGGTINSGPGGGISASTGARVTTIPCETSGGFASSTGGDAPEGLNAITYANPVIGSAGGGVNASNVIGKGGSNGSGYTGLAYGGGVDYILGGTTDGASGTDGTSTGAALLLPVGHGGAGGAGGSVNGGNGGNGFRGGGGGGGGAGTTGTSGAGGNGGNGFARITLYF